MTVYDSLPKMDVITTESFTKWAVPFQLKTAVTHGTSKPSFKTLVRLSEIKFLSYCRGKNRIICTKRACRKFTSRSLNNQLAMMIFFQAHDVNSMASTTNQAALSLLVMVVTLGEATKCWRVYAALTFSICRCCSYTAHV